MYKLHFCFKHFLIKVDMTFIRRLKNIIFILSIFILSSSLISNKQVNAKVSLDISSVTLQKKQPILLIELLVNRDNQTMEILSMKKGNGFVPDYSHSIGTDYLEVNITNNDNTVHKIYISLPEKVIYDQLSKEVLDTSSNQESLNTFTYPIIIPYTGTESVKIIKNFRTFF